MASKKLTPKLFFSSDLHIGHRNILKYSPVRAKIVGSNEDVEKHDRILIKRWNSIVRPEDIVIIAGDIKLCGNIRARECIAQLHGKKILVRGNHDLSASKMMRLGFDWVCDEMHVNIGGTRVLISHYPYRLSTMKYYYYKTKQLFYKKEVYDFRKMHRRPIDTGMILLHGHTHQEDKVRGRMIHVGLDSWNMFPVSQDVILKHINIIKKKEKVRG